MNKDLNELLEYNNEYMEAQISEEIFGGDYTSAVELKYAQQELDKYKNIVDEIKKLCDENTNGVDDDGYDDAYYDRVYVREIDEIIEKELKGE